MHFRTLRKTESKIPDRYRKGWPTVAVFRGSHNHAISSAAVLKYRDLGVDSKQRLCELFRQGHSASSALHCLKTDLLIKHGDKYYEVAADGQFVPSLSVACKLFNKEFHGEYGSTSGPEMFSTLENMLKDFNDNLGCRTKFGRIEANYYVTICTPLMARAHKLLRQTSELVMVDAAGGLDKQRHRLYLFVTPTAAGGVPIGAIITNSEQELIFEAALKDLMECFPEESFFGQGFPTLFLTDNDLKERQPLQRLFPQSRLLLCQFHMLKAVWSWLCDSKHGVSRDDRQEVYMVFKSVLYAPTEMEMSEKFDKLLGLTAFDENERCDQYFQSLWACKEDWASAYRPGLPLRGSNTTNYVEVAFRILKDCVFDRVMAFTLPQMIDFIVTRYAAYMEKRLLDFSSERYCKALLRNMIPKQADIPDSSITTVDAAAGLYTVRSAHSDEVYSVDLAGGYCTCYSGVTGGLCKHASAVLLRADAELSTAYNIVSSEAKAVLFEVATGTPPSQDWLMPLHSIPPTGRQPTSNQDYDSSDTVDYDPTEATSQRDQRDTADDPGIERLTADEKQGLENLFSRIWKGVQEAPQIFVPACRRMVTNTQKFASTETGLVSALYTFGKYTGLPKAKQHRSWTAGSHKRRGVQIGVQPTAVGRRRLTLPGKRKVGAGRPQGIVTARRSHMATHDYTTFGTLPSRKRKAPHNLQECVYRNTGLGQTKHARDC